jgi:hypothetical protein
LIDVVWACSRLEALAAAEALAAGNPATAVDCLGRILRLAGCLAAERRPTTRLEAAYIRTEALAILEAIAVHSRTGAQLLARLHAMVRDSLEAWTDDSQAWIGDRALGMWVYEAARAGRVLDILTPDEIRRFSMEDVLSELPERVKRSVDEDELYYLQSMRTIIDGCARPYYARAHLFETIREELHAQRNAPEFPFVAGRMLLVDVEKGHKVQARDRANWEAAALALATTCGKPLPPYEISPLTGRRYEVVRQDGMVTVRFGRRGEGAKVAVPDRSEASPQ